MAKQLVPINGSVLRWAREQVGWINGHVFVLVCGYDILCIPVEKMRRYEPILSVAKNGRELQPNIYRTKDGRFELRARGYHIDLTAWKDRFDLI